MSNIETRGYAHPEVLVSTDWVAAHLNDPSVRIIESNEDTLLYASGHIPASVNVDWTSDLNDQLRRDYITREGFEQLMSRIGATQGHHGGVLRRQEQLVGLLRLLGVPALRPHQRPGDGRRPHQVGEGEAAGHARGADLRARPATRPRNATTPRSARSATKCSRTCRRSGSSSTCAAPTSTPASACTCPTTPTRARSAAATSPAPRASPGRAHQPRRRHVQDRRRSSKKIYVEEKQLTPTQPTIAYCRIGERSSHTWFALKYLLGFENVRNYDGSWTEWGNMVGVPIEK